MTPLGLILQQLEPLHGLKLPLICPYQASDFPEIIEFHDGGPQGS